MKVKRMVKHLFAVGAGLAMLGATAAGAMAADLKDYPSQFVKDGVFNGYIVVGEKANAVDNLAATDIASAMKYLKKGDATTTTVSGDAWKVETSAKKYELSNNNATSSSIGGENIYEITSSISKAELQALASGTYSTGDGSYGYDQYLYFDPVNVKTSEIVKYVEDDDDVAADFFYVQSGKNITKYTLEFTSQAQSDVTDVNGGVLTTGTYLDDFENTKITMLGKEYTIVMARRITTGGNNIKLVLMSGAVKDTLLEGEEKTFTVEGKEYKVKLSYVDNTYAKFTVNGESTDKLQVGDTKKLSDGKEVGVSEVLYQGYAGGVHSASFFLGAGKIELKDDYIDESIDTTNYAVIKGGSEDVDGTHVYIDGTDNNSTVKLTSIRVDMIADDDYWVPAGKKLSEIIAANGDEEEVLFTNNWDFEYKGLTSEKSHNIGLSSNTDRKYTLKWFDGGNNAVNMPLFYAFDSANVSLSEDATDKAMQLNESWAIYKNDYFVVTGDGANAATMTPKSYLLQYKGADKLSATSPKIKFKNVGSGETLEYTVASANPRATIKLGGYSFIVQNISTAVSDDFQIMVDMDGDADYADTTFNTISDYYGARFTIGASIMNFTGEAHPGMNTTCRPNTCFAASATVAIDSPNGNDWDTVDPKTITMTVDGAATNEVTVSTFNYGGSNNLVSPTGTDNTYYGYTSMGGKLTYTTPTGAPPELTYDYPEKQRIPQLYVTSGAVTTSSTADGTWTAVEIVDATKLDSEIADVKAQNLIVVGGPCVNTAAAALLGNPATCTEGFAPGKARIKLFEPATGKFALLVAGYSGADTRLAGKVIAHRWKELSGTEVEVEGTTYSDAKIGAPTPVVVPETPATPAATTQ